MLTYITLTRARHVASNHQPSISQYMVFNNLISVPFIFHYTGPISVFSYIYYLTDLLMKWFIWKNAFVILFPVSNGITEIQ